MKKLLFTLLLITSLSSFARLDETLEQCTKRYGKPFAKRQKEGYYFFLKTIT